MTTRRPYRLADLPWPAVAERAADSVLAVPLGATEQHGPHLPCTVDTDVAAELCDRLARVRDRVLVAPAVNYGSSGEHAGFAGTLSIGQEATELLVVELARSADAFAGVLLVCGHGGNADPLRRAVTRLRAESRDVRAWAPAGPPTDTHAGRVETSVMLALRPSAVRVARPVGDTRPLPRILDRLRTEGVRAVSPNGVLGDPRDADADEGHRILDTWTTGLLARFDTWWPATGDDDA